jgi:hypothetical protein
MVQIRVIGPADHVRRLLAHLAEQAIPLFSQQVTCRKQVRAARSAGHVRAYLTVSRKETANDA